MDMVGFEPITLFHLSHHVCIFETHRVSVLDLGLVLSENPVSNFYAPYP